MEKLRNVGCIKNIEMPDKSKKMQWSVQSLNLQFDSSSFKQAQLDKWAIGACWIYIQGLLRSRFDSAEEVRGFLAKHNYTLSQVMIDDLLSMATRAPRKDPGVSLVERIKKMPEGPERDALKEQYIAMLQEI